MLHSALQPGHEADHSPVELAHERPTIIGPVLVEPSLRRLSSASGELTLEPKVMQVLVALLREPGSILSRDDLLEICWNGHIVGDASINRVISLLRSALRELAGTAVVIETVARVGYRLLVPGEGAEQEHDRKPLFDGLRRAAARYAPWRLLLVLLLAAGLVAAGIWAIARPASAGVSLAVLPLEAEAASDGFYAAGLTGEIRNRLSGQSGLTIQGSKSAESLAQAGVAPVDIGRRLRLDAVLAGRMRRDGDTLVLVLSLYATAEGRETWSQEFRSPIERATDMPQRATTALRETLDLTMPRDGTIGGISAASYSNYLIAKGMLRTREPEQIGTAERMLVSLTRDEPGFARGWAALAKAISLGRGQPDMPGEEQAMAAARGHAARAVKLDPDNSETLAVAGLVAATPRQSQLLLERAVAVDPGNAEAWLWLSNAYSVQGLEGRAINALTRQLRLDPLWMRSWQAPEAAAAVGNVALANRLDKEVFRVAVEPWQRQLAVARTVRRAGDWSRYLELSRTAALGAPPGKRDAIDYHRMVALAYLGLPIEGYRTKPEWAAYVQLLHGRAPSPRLLQSAGIPLERYFRDGTTAVLAPQLLMRDGRGDELVALFDRRYGSVSQLVGRRTTLSGELSLAAAPYLMLALRQAGRTNEDGQIAAHFLPELRRAQDNSADFPVDRLVGLARVAAAGGRPDAARQLFERARAKGWPDVASLELPPQFGALAADPALASLVGLAWFRRMATEVETERASEREESRAPAALA